MLLHLCQNEGFCIADCPLRSICKKQRINLLINAVVVDYKENTIYKDEYLNEIAILKQNLVDKERNNLKNLATSGFHSFNSHGWSKFEIIEV